MAGLAIIVETHIRRSMDAHGVPSPLFSRACLPIDETQPCCSHCGCHGRICCTLNLSHTRFDGPDPRVPAGAGRRVVRTRDLGAVRSAPLHGAGCSLPGIATRPGAPDLEIRDTVLIAAAFCMYNRYIDGFATWQPQDESTYAVMGRYVVDYCDCTPSLPWPKPASGRPTDGLLNDSIHIYNFC